MRTLIYVFLVILCCHCSKKKQYLLGETPFQKKMNAEFKDVTKSPLKEKDRKEFRGLAFFKFDSSFVVKATIKRTPNSDFFAMKTTTFRKIEQRVYGILSFKIKDQPLQLKIYQAKTIRHGHENYLFLPFLDRTNGDMSYEGGRYLELQIPQNDTLLIDFNKAYNPYCVYNEKYSCPIVPRENYLEVKIEAGVKNFNKLSF